jgi:hypothetical protein
VVAGAIFLTVLRTNDNFCLPQLSWVALLSIAHRYEFTNVRERAIREIYDRGPGKYPDARWANTDPDSHVDPVSDHAMLISAAEKCDVPPQQVVSTFVALVMRRAPLTEAEVALLSIGTIVRLARAREDFSRKATTNNRPPEYAAKRIVCGIWGLPQERDIYAL